MTWRPKNSSARRIGEAGLELHTGIMAGLSPDETKYQDYVDFIFQARQYANLTRVYVTKFTPFSGIPMEEFPACSAQEAARLIAVTRPGVERYRYRSGGGMEPG